MPCDVMLKNKAGGKEARGSDVFKNDIVCIPKTMLHMMGPAFLEVADNG